MRKLVLLSLSLLVFISCSEDKNEIKSTKASIVGVWKFKKSETLSGKDLTKVLKTKEDNCSKKNIYEFTSANEYKPVFHYVQNNECKEQANSSIENYRYDKEKKRLYLRKNSDRYADVIELTQNSLIYGWYEADTDEDGTIDYNKIYLYK